MAEVVEKLYKEVQIVGLHDSIVRILVKTFDVCAAVFFQVLPLCIVVIVENKIAACFYVFFQILIVWYETFGILASNAPETPCVRKACDKFGMARDDLHD